ncbi:acyltransferase family protein [Nocardioides sp. W3-2-3]|uniref:acyltransferase family protein n=1 Tax=Nocardioides convexus TaxID=2712224 RepID=UPI00241832E4|nr:acyltransferase family protein [Nocardioides convexus]NHA01746.1 acyltransferase family protein [Nocardioides convexus]
MPPATAAVAPTTTEHAPPKGEILSLTGLRAVAALAVVVHHTGLPPSAPEWAAKIAQCGFIGVPLFFMLSGFVLAYNYPTLSPRSGWRKVVRFWVARIARVMPLYWVVLIWAICMREFRGIPQDSSLPLHFLGLQTWSGDLSVGAQMYNAPGWSICVELFLYALFPFLVPVVAMAARRFGARGLLALAGLAFAVQAHAVGDLRHQRQRGPSGRGPGLGPPLALPQPADPAAGVRGRHVPGVPAGPRVPDAAGARAPEPGRGDRLRAGHVRDPRPDQRPARRGLLRHVVDGPVRGADHLAGVRPRLLLPVPLGPGHGDAGHRVVRPLHHPPRPARRLRQGVRHQRTGAVGVRRRRGRHRARTCPRRGCAPLRRVCRRASGSSRSPTGS